MTAEFPRITADGRYVVYAAGFGPDAFGGRPGVYLKADRPA